MRIIKFTLILLSVFFITACSDSFLRAMDEFNAGMGGQRTCVKEAAYETDSFDGFSYKTGGLCNFWQGQINNYSDYTIRCVNTINGSRANTVYASPRQTTDLKQIGHMSGSLDYTCRKWDRSPQVWKNYTDRKYQILIKMSSGRNYLSIKNMSSSTRRCYFQNQSKKTLIEAKVGYGQSTDWVRSPDGRFFTNCVY